MKKIPMGEDLFKATVKTTPGYKLAVRLRRWGKQFRIDFRLMYFDALKDKWKYSPKMGIGVPIRRYKTLRQALLEMIEAVDEFEGLREKKKEDL